MSRLDHRGWRSSVDAEVEAPVRMGYAVPDDRMRFYAGRISRMGSH